VPSVLQTAPKPQPPNPWPAKPEIPKARKPGFFQSLFAFLLLAVFAIALHFTRNAASPTPAAVVTPPATPLSPAAEARAHLLSCPATAKLCLSQQKRFVDSFILSRDGATYFMGDIIGFLDPRFAAEPGFRVDRIYACAWRYVRFTVSTVPRIADIYRRDWAASCRDNPDLDEAAQKAAILALVNEIKTAPEPQITPELAALRDRDAALEPAAVAIIEKALPPGH
jgi:hypothetical protein